MTDSSLLLRLDLQSDPELLAVIRSMLQRLTEVMGFSPSECRSITIAVDEALANIIRHAYESKPGRRIRISFRRIYCGSVEESRTGLEIMLSDHGSPIDPLALRGRHLDDIRPGGLGLHLIRESVDLMQFSRIGRTNQLRLVKYPRERKEEQGTAKEES